MNKIYKVIYNRARNMYQVVSEIVHSRGKTRSLQSRVRPQSLARLVAATLLAMSIGLPVGWAADGDSAGTTTSDTTTATTKITSGNTDSVTGGDVYTEVRPTADKNYVKSTQTTAENLTSLDTQVKKNETAIATNTSSIAAKADKTDLDSKANTSMDNLSDAGKQVIQALMEIQNSGNVTVSSTTTTAGVKTYTITVKTDGAVASGNTGIVSGGTLYSEVRPTTDGTYVKSAKTTAENLTALDTQVNTNTTDISNLKNLSNITTDGKTAIKNLLSVVGDNDQVTVTPSEDSTSGMKTYTVSVKKNGKISATDENIVTGKTVYEYFNQQIGTVANGTYVKSGNTIAANLANLDTNLKNVIDAIGLDENDTTQSYTSKLNKYFKVNPEITTSTDGTKTYAADAAANGTNSIAIGPSAQAGESTKDATTSTTTVTGGTSSTAVGDSAKANGDKSVALGYSAQVLNTTDTTGATTTTISGGVALGDEAKVNGASDATAIGTKAQVNETARGGIAIGKNAVTGEDKGTVTVGDVTANVAAIGGADSVALGTNAAANGSEALALGNGAQVKNYTTQAGTTVTKTLSTGSTAIGDEAVVEGANNALALGSGAAITGTGTNSDNSMALGKSATVTNATDAIAEGSSAAVADGANNGIALGNTAKANTSNTTAIGYKASATGAGAVAIGENTSTNTEGGVSIGSGTSASGKSIVIGYATDTDGTTVKTESQNLNAIAIGNGAQANVNDSVSIGHQAGMNTSEGRTSGYGSLIAIGTNAGNNVKGMQNVALGSGAGSNVKSSYNVAIGSNAGAGINYAADKDTNPQNGYNISIGVDANYQSADANAKNIMESIAIGHSTNAVSNAIAMGYNTTASGDKSMALGYNATAADTDSIALGDKASAGGGNIAIGSGSLAPSITTYGTSYLTNNTNVDGYVSLGGQTSATTSKTVLRRISNVADGSADQDAVTVAQLKAAYTDLEGTIKTTDTKISDTYTQSAIDTKIANVESKITNAQTKYFSINTSSDTLTANADNSGATTEGAADAMAIGPNASATKAKAVAIGNNVLASGKGSIAIGTADNPATSTTTTAGGNTSANPHVTSAEGSNSVAVGTSSIAQTDNSVAIGTRASVYTSDVTDSTTGTTTKVGQQSVAIGYQAETRNTNAISIGSDAKAYRNGSTAVGHSAFAQGADSVVVGTSSTANGDDSGILGKSNTINGSNTYAVGSENNVNGNWGAVSYSNINGSKNTITPISDTSGSTVHGMNNLSVTGNSNTINQGSYSDTVNNISILGNSNSVTGDNEDSGNAGTTTNITVIGGSNTIAGKDGAGFDGYGIGTWKTLERTTVIGYGNTVNQAGNSTLSSLANTQILGNDVTATLGNSVYLGTGAAAKTANLADSTTLTEAETKAADAVDTTGKTDTEIATAQAEAKAKARYAENLKAMKKSGTTAGLQTLNTDTTYDDGTSYSYAGSTPTGVVTVGKVGSERRIQNVAAGLVSASSTDAVNGSQLYALTRQLRFGGDNSTFGATSDADTNVIARGSAQTLAITGGGVGVTTSTTNGVTTTTVDSTKLTDKNISVIADTDANALNVKLASNLTSLNTAQLGTGSGDSYQETIKLDGTGTNGGTLTLDDAKGANGVTLRTSGSATTKDLSGTAATRLLVNDKTVATMDDGMTVGGDSGTDSKLKLNSKLTIKGGINSQNAANRLNDTNSNIGVTSDGNGTLTVKLSKDVVLGNYQSGTETTDKSGTLRVNGGSYYSMDNGSSISLYKSVGTADGSSKYPASGDTLGVTMGMTSKNGGYIGLFDGSGANEKYIFSGDTVNGIPRIQYNNGTTTGTTYSLATLNDGTNYKDDAGNSVSVALNKTLTLSGGATTDSTKTVANWTTGNISVVSSADTTDGTANGNGTMSIRLAKNLDLSGDGSLKTGATTISNSGLTNGSTTLNGTGLTITNGPSVTTSGITANGKIAKVTAGTDNTDAANVAQIKAATTEVEAGDNVASVTKEQGRNQQNIYKVNVKDLTYTANGTSKTTSLEKGLSFAAGTNTTAEIDNTTGAIKINATHNKLNANGSATKATADSNAVTLTLTDADNNTTTTALTDTYTTVSKDADTKTVTFKRNDGESQTLKLEDLGGITAAQDKYVMGGTVSYDDNGTGTASLTGNNGLTATITGLKNTKVSSGTASYIDATGAATVNGTATLTMNDGTKATITGLQNDYITTATVTSTGTNKNHVTLTRLGGGTVDVNLNPILDNYSLSDYRLVGNGDTQDKAYTVGSDGTVTLNVVDSKNAANKKTIQITGLASQSGVNASRTTVTSSDSSVKVTDSTSNSNTHTYDIQVDYTKIPSNLKVQYSGDNGITGSNTMDKATAFNGTAGQIETAATDGKVSFQLAKDITGIDSVTTGNAKLDTNGLTINENGTEKVAITSSKVNMGGNVVSNMGGAVNDNDAATLGQVKSARTLLQQGTNTKLTDSENGNQHTYTVNVDNLAVKANGTGTTTVELAKGINFNNGTNTTSTVDAQGNVTIDTKNLNVKVNGTNSSSVTMDTGLDFVNGTNTTADVTNGKVSFNVSDDAIKAQAKSAVSLNAGDNVTIGTPTETDTNKTYTISVDNLKLQANSVDAGSRKLADGLNFANDSNTKVSVSNGTITYGLKDDISLTSVKTGNSSLNTKGLTITNGPSVLASGINAGDQAITNVASGGDTDTNAANISDVKRLVADASSTTTSTGFKVKGDDATAKTVQLGKQLNVTGGATSDLTDGNVGVTTSADAQGNATLSVKLKKDIDLGTTGSVKTGATTMNNAGITNGSMSLTNTGLTITNTDASKQVSLTTSGVSMGSQRVQNVADGKADTDAVNLKQLKNARTVVAAGSNVSSVDVKDATDDSNQKTYTVNVDNLSVKANNETAKNVTLKTGLTFNNGTNTTAVVGDNGITYNLNDTISLTKVTTGNSSLDTNGLTITGGPSVTTSGINAGSKKITNVANGETASDAVNKGQLDALQTQVTNSSWTLSGKDDSSNAVTAKIGNGKKVTYNNGNYTKSVVSKDDAGNAAVKVDVTTGTLTAKTDGTIASTDGVATTGDVATAVNSAAWTIEDADHADNAQTVKAGDTVALKAGDNLLLSQDGKKFTYSLNKVVTGMTSVTAVDDKQNTSVLNGEGLKVTDAQGNALTQHATEVRLHDANKAADDTTTDVVLNKQGLQNGGHTITGVADGKVVAGSQEAVNGGQLYALQQKVGSGWKITGNNTASTTSIGADKTVSFINGKNSTVTVSGSDSGATVKVDVDTATLSTKDNKAVASGSGVADAGEVAEAINNAAWTVEKAGSEAQAQQVKADTTVTFGNDENLTLSQNGTAFTYGLASNVDISTIRLGGTKGADGVWTGGIYIGKQVGGGANANDGNYITGLGNTAWDLSKVVDDRAATEGQLKAAINQVTIASQSGGFGLRDADGNTVTQMLGQTVSIVGDTEYAPDGKTITKQGNITTEADSKNIGGIKVKLSDNVKLADTGSLTVGQSKVTNGKVELDNTTDTSKKIMLDSSTGTAAVGGVIVNGSEKTVTGLSNTNWDATKANVAVSAGGYQGSTKAATESQLAAAISQATTTAQNNELHVQAGTYNVTTKTDAQTGAKTNSVTMNIVDGAGATKGQVVINDVAKASDLGDTTQLADAVKTKNGDNYQTTSVVEAVNNLNTKVDNRVGDNQYSAVTNKDIDVQDGDSSTTAIAKLNKRMTDIYTTAGQHTTVSNSDKNLILTKTENGATNYQIDLNKEKLDLGNVTIKGNEGSIAAKSMTADTFTAGSTVVNNDGVKVGDKSALTGDTLKVNGKTYVSGDGINANSQKITNVADGSNDGDAVNVKQVNELAAQQNAAINQNASNINQLDRAVNRLDSRINRVGAGAAALAALHPGDYDPNDKVDFAAGFGNYRGASAAAVGVYYHPDETTTMSVGASFGGGENMVNAGVTWKMGKDSGHMRKQAVRTVPVQFVAANTAAAVPVSAANAAVKTPAPTTTTTTTTAANGQQVPIVAAYLPSPDSPVRAENDELKELLARQTAILEKLTEQKTGQPAAAAPAVSGDDLYPDVPENHWAYDFVGKLAKAGVLKGCSVEDPVNNPMLTRNDFAQILYTALKNGATKDPALNKDGGLNHLASEFRAELKNVKR
ncbi:ESPR-type extended signal peptide-containing protein [Mitsuokella sp. WILCCON 0060]|uniref:ESPR-type extended signal peptide-containing protein n=1 Tax=Mitsuokella sp. WILCCON 0060 TaxID=3345341 RepID=UPI003F1AAD11